MSVADNVNEWKLYGLEHSFHMDDFVGEIIVATHRNRKKRGWQDRILFDLADGRRVLMYHAQDCCESVGIEEIHGYFKDLLDTPILEAREEVSHTDSDDDDDSQTWTFYKFQTIKGPVTIRWYGTSNGYYSESVHLSLVLEGDIDG